MMNPFNDPDFTAPGLLRLSGDPDVRQLAALALEAGKAMQLTFPASTRPAVFVATSDDLMRLPALPVRGAYYDGKGLVRLNTAPAPGCTDTIGFLQGIWCEPLRVHPSHLRFDTMFGATGVLTLSEALTAILSRWEAPFIIVRRGEERYEIRCSDHEAEEYPTDLPLAAHVDTLHVEATCYYYKAPHIIIDLQC